MCQQGFHVNSALITQELRRHDAVEQLRDDVFQRPFTSEVVQPRLCTLLTGKAGELPSPMGAIALHGTV